MREKACKLASCDEQVCGSSSWIIPLGLALPYAWRLCQCIRVYRDTGVRTNVSPPFDARSTLFERFHSYGDGQSCSVLHLAFSLANSHHDVTILRDNDVNYWGYYWQGGVCVQRGIPCNRRRTDVACLLVQLFNALKYSTAFPVIIFSALKYQVKASGSAAVVLCSPTQHIPAPAMSGMG